MRTMDWKRSLSVGCLAVGLGATNVLSLSAQERRLCAEPAGMPVSGGSSSANRSAFSAETYNSYFQSKADEIAYRQYSYMQMVRYRQYVAAVEAQRVEEAAEAAKVAADASKHAEVAAAAVGQPAQAPRTTTVVSRGLFGRRRQVVSQDVASTSIQSTGTMPSNQVVMLNQAPGSIVVHQDGGIDGEVASSELLAGGSENVLSRKVMAERIYRMNSDGSQTLISNEEFANPKVEIVEAPQIVGEAPMTNGEILTAVPAETTAKPVASARKKHFAGGAVPLLPPVMVNEQAARPGDSISR